jgi:lipid-A-disaccharide synthase
VGNPTADEVTEFRSRYDETFGQFCLRNGLDPHKKIIALLAGSRRQEIKDNLPAMMEVAGKFTDYQVVLAGAPAIDDDYYAPFLEGHAISMVKNDTYPLLANAHAALVTSGTATLETALFGVPQVVCYETPLPWLIGYLRRKVLSVNYISLVNLVADREVVRELVADSFTLENIYRELSLILEGEHRQKMLSGYDEVVRRLGKEKAPANAARIMIDLLSASAKSPRN